MKVFQVEQVLGDHHVAALQFHDLLGELGQPLQGAFQLAGFDLVHRQLLLPDQLEVALAGFSADLLGCHGRTLSPALLSTNSIY